MSANSDLTHRSKKEPLFARRRAQVAYRESLGQPPWRSSPSWRRRRLMGRAHRLAGLMTIVYVAYRDAVAYACGCISLSNSGRFASKVDDERTQPGEREDALDALPVRTMTADDEGPAIETVVLAFAADPVMRWAWPHPHQYMAAM